MKKLLSEKPHSFKMRTFSKNLCREALVDYLRNKSGGLRHLSLKDRGPMCSLKVSKDVKGKGAKGRAREQESEDVPMSALL